MAESAPRTAIPADFLSLDEDLYDSGAPTHAMLGARLAQRSRKLHAMLRRGFSECWPENQTDPQPAIYDGTILGPYPWVPTPGLREGRWYLIINAPVGWSVRVAPFRSPGLTLRTWRETDYECVGAGAKTIYGPISVDMSGLSRPCEIGLILWLDFGAIVATSSGNVQSASENMLTSTVAGDFTGVPIPGSLVRILDAAGDPMTPWSPIGKVSAAGDVCLAYPLLYGTGITVVDSDAATWELYEATGVARMVTVAWFEMPLSGRL